MDWIRAWQTMYPFWARQDSFVPFSMAFRSISKRHVIFEGFSVYGNDSGTLASS